MEVETFFLYLLAILLTARIFAELAVRLRAPSVIGEHHIEEQMKPIVHLFTPIFFVMVGISLNLQDIDWGSSFIWVFSLSLLVAAIVGKLLGAW